MTEQFSTIDRWLVDNGHLWSDLSTALGELVEQLNQEGMEIERSNIYLPTLHPQVDSNLSVWRRGEGFIETSQTATVLDVNERPYKSGVLKDIELGHRHGINPAYKSSPIYHVIEGGNKEVLAKFTSNSTSYDYPIFKDFVDSGATAYFGHKLKLDNTKRSFVSFLTNKDGGYTDEEISTLRTICAPLALIVNRFGAQRVTNTLVRTYLGQDPGKMVLSGQIKQGDVKSMDAAIWFSDLRGFTSMSSTLAPEVLIATLNKYFAALGPVFDQTGGEILKFIGDAILAVFPASRFQSSTQACVSALTAATQAKVALDLLNTSFDTPLEHGIALHFGKIEYGNIGTENRLDFTVIGKAVNLASRIESLCSETNRDVLLSEDFATISQCKSVEVGRYTLKGIPDQQLVFAPSE